MPRVSDLQNSVDTCLSRPASPPGSQGKNEAGTVIGERGWDPLRDASGSAPETSWFFLPVETPGPREHRSVASPGQTQAAAGSPGAASFAMKVSSAPCTVPANTPTEKMGPRPSIGGKGL